MQAQDDFTKLDRIKHMLWFTENPYADIRSSIERMLTEQVADSDLKSLRVVSEPHTLTRARRNDPEKPNIVTVVACGLAFEFELEVESRGKSYQLSGVFTRVGYHLDTRDSKEFRVWLDLDGDLDTFGENGELKTRLYAK